MGERELQPLLPSNPTTGAGTDQGYYQDSLIHRVGSMTLADLLRILAIAGLALPQDAVEFAALEAFKV